MIVTITIIFVITIPAYGDTVFYDNFSSSYPGSWTIGHDGGRGTYAWAWPNGYAHEYSDPYGV